MVAASRSTVLMPVLADSEDHRHPVTAVSQAATDDDLLVVPAPPPAAQVDEFSTPRPPGYSAGFPDNGEIKPKYPPYVEDMAILEKPLYPKR